MTTLTSPRTPLIFGLLALWVFAPVQLWAQSSKTPSADKIYYDGNIITMEGDEPELADAVVVHEGKIQFVGDLETANQFADISTVKIDLKGKTLLPGFIDGHGHIYLTGIQRLSANLLPPPDGTGDSIDALVQLLKTYEQDGGSSVQGVGWIFGFGYDDSQLKEKRHPTALDLDKVSQDLPVMIIHQSGHLASVNHKALELLGYSANSPDPKGGKIRRMVDGITPNGVLEEMAFFQGVYQILAKLTVNDQAQIALAGTQFYTEFGYTTGQDGRATEDGVKTWFKLADAGRLPIDIAIYPDLQANEAFMKTLGTSNIYKGHVRVAGVKLSFDGSPQGKTAWLSEPYLHPPEGEDKNYVGYPAIPDADERQRLVNLAYANNWQLLVHCNGDAASEALIDAVAVAAEKYGNEGRRNVMVHAQTVREDQLDRMEELGIVPSFFTMHTYYWGDWHRDETLGPVRAAHISPTRSALKRGMKFTTHHDAPVALPSAIMILHTTVNRTSRTGKMIGADQRVSPYIALKSLTDWAAWQYFEEQNKGTLTPGKEADFVILDQDPLTIEPEQLMNIKVLETIKNGETVFQL